MQLHGEARETYWRILFSLFSNVFCFRYSRNVNLFLDTYCDITEISRLTIVGKSTIGIPLHSIHHLKIFNDFFRFEHFDSSVWIH